MPLLSPHCYMSPEAITFEGYFDFESPASSITIPVALGLAVS